MPPSRPAYFKDNLPLLNSPTMLAQQLRESSSLFDSLDALRDWRALLLLVLVFMAAAVVWAAGGWMLVSTGHSTPLFLCAALAVALLLWGVNSAGFLMMDQSAGRPGRTLGQAMRASLGATQQLILVLLALALFYLIGLLALTVLVLVCSVPVLGPWLYVLVFPVGVAASGLALFILPTLVIPLCAPAIWCGLDASTGLAQLWAAMRHRLALVLSWMLLLSCITAAVGLVLAAMLFLGFSVTGSVSAAILGASLGPWPGVGGPPSLTAPGVSGLAAYLQAGALGSMLLWAAACAIPGLVAMKGACIVYRRALLGLSTVQEEQALSQTLTSAFNRARGLCDPVAQKAAPNADAASTAAWQPSPASAFLTPSPPAIAASPASPHLDGESAQVHRMMMCATGGVRDTATPSTAFSSANPGAASPEPVSPPFAHAPWAQHASVSNAAAAGQPPTLPQSSSARPGPRQQAHHAVQQQPAWLQPPPSVMADTASNGPRSVIFATASTHAASGALPGNLATAAPLDLDLDLEAPYAGTAPSTTPFPSPAVALSSRSTTTQKNCPFCGGDTELADFFCGHCGQPLPK